MGNCFTFDVTAFRLQFPAFADPTIYSDVLLQSYWDLGTCFCSDKNWGRLNNNCRLQALNYLTAHFAQFFATAATDNYQGLNYIPTAATVDKVTIALNPPPSVDQLQWTLNTTVYGQTYLALLRAKAVGGFTIIVGPPERNSFRKNYGYFGW